LLPSQPPRDVNGVVQPHNHSEILDDDGIIRRVDPIHHIVSDIKSPTGKRISSKLLKQSGGVSVDLQRPIEEDMLDARKFVTTPKYIGSVRFTAGNLRYAGFLVGYDPVAPDDPQGPANPYHGLLWNKITASSNAKLLQSATWFVPLEGVTLV
jgi:hypothetical protein